MLCTNDYDRLDRLSILGTQRYMKILWNFKSLCLGSLSLPLSHSFSHFVLITLIFANQLNTMNTMTVYLKYK